MANSTAPTLHKNKRHRSNQNTASQTSSLPSASHGECLMAKGRKKKKTTKVESEEEEEKEEGEEYDFDFDKLSK
jgi:ribosomal protein L12E/L44/L45/RPP1/RPP2